MAEEAFKSFRVGDFAHLDIERVAVKPTDRYAVAGVKIAGQGLFWRETIAGSETNYRSLHRLRAGQLVYRKLTAWEGPITVVPAEYDGAFVSSEFPAFTLDETIVIADYLRLLCQRPAFHAEMKLRSTGTAERRGRLKPADLLEVEVELPDVVAQGRIVDAVAAADAVIAALAAELRAAARSLTAARETLMGDLATVPLADVVDHVEAGKSPKCPERPRADGELGVLKVSAIRPLEFRYAEVKPVPAGFEFPAHAVVRRGDILISRANTRALVGAVCLVDIDPVDTYLSDKTLRLVPDVERVTPPYLVHALTTSTARQQIEAAASGTSDSMKNIGQRDILSTEIPIADRETQENVAMQLEVFRRYAKATAEQHAAAMSARAALLEELLSGRRAVRADARPGAVRAAA